MPLLQKAGFVLLTNIEKMKEKQVRKPPVKPTVLTGSKESKKILFGEIHLLDILSSNKNSLYLFTLNNQNKQGLKIMLFNGTRQCNIQIFAKIIFLK